MAVDKCRGRENWIKKELYRQFDNGLQNLVLDGPLHIRRGLRWSFLDGDVILGKILNLFGF